MGGIGKEHESQAQLVKNWSSITANARFYGPGMECKIQLKSMS